MYQLSKKINNHEFIITLHVEMGGADECICLWCTTCDLVGNDVITWWMEDYSLTDAMALAMDEADGHASSISVEDSTKTS